MRRSRLGMAFAPILPAPRPAPRSACATAAGRLAAPATRTRMCGARCAFRPRAGSVTEGRALGGARAPPSGPPRCPPRPVSPAATPVRLRTDREGVIVEAEAAAAFVGHAIHRLGAHLCDASTPARQRDGCRPPSPQASWPGAVRKHCKASSRTATLECRSRRKKGSGDRSAASAAAAAAAQAVVGLPAASAAPNDGDARSLVRQAAVGLLGSRRPRRATSTGWRRSGMGGRGSRDWMGAYCYSRAPPVPTSSRRPYQPSPPPGGVPQPEQL